MTGSRRSSPAVWAIRTAGQALFTYCTQVLHLSEHAAYHRIEAARAARRYPEILERLASGDVALTAVTLLAPHLTGANYQQLLLAARHKSKCEVEHLVAALRPQADVPSIVRKLPSVATVGPAPALEGLDGLADPKDSAVAGATPSTPSARRPIAPAARAAVVAPIAPERYKVQLTISRETHDKLCRARAPKKACSNFTTSCRMRIRKNVDCVLPHAALI